MYKCGLIWYRQCVEDENFLLNKLDAANSMHIRHLQTIFIKDNQHNSTF